MTLLPMSAVVGTNIVKSDIEKRNIASPLFAIRTQRSLNKDETKQINSNYLGKGKILNLFFLKKSSLQNYVDKALKLIDKQPQILHSVINKITTMPEIVNLLKENGLTLDDFKNQMNQLINNPILLKEKVDVAFLASPFGDDPVPLGLSTSNPLGCFIIALIMAPIFAMIGMIIATITIVTCLNIGGCFLSICIDCYGIGCKSFR